MSTILNFNFHGYWFKWIDFMLESNETLLEAMGTSEIEIYPAQSKPILHGETRIDEMNGEAHVTTPDQIWSFALSIDLGPPVVNLQRAGGHTQSEYWIEVEIIVTRGTVGILLATEDFGRALTQDNMVRTGEHPETISISVPPHWRARHLVFRNAEGGGSSEFTVKHIRLISPKGRSKEAYRMKRSEREISKPGWRSRLSRMRDLFVPPRLIATPAAVPQPHPDRALAEVEAVVPPGWDDPLAVLRRKWGEIPSGNDLRHSSADLLQQNDASIIAHFERARQHDTEGTGWGIRGWYHDMYRPLMPGRSLLDVGCGMGISTITFAEMGARVTFTDIIPDNVELVRRICRIKGIRAEFLWIERFEDIDRLPDDFDVVTALGSLINAPLAVTRSEIARIKQHLRLGGRWLHFAYPKARWVREGSLPWAQWGEHTDGPGTPWVEYHDRAKMEWLFAPSKVRILFDCEWHDSDFNWFDLELVAH